MQQDVDVIPNEELLWPSIEDTMVAKPVGLHWTNWVTLFIAFALFIGGVLGSAHYEIGRLDDRIAAVDKHIGRVETAVRIVGAKQGGDTKTLIDEALIVAQNASDTNRPAAAKTALDIANRLLEQQKSARAPAPESFFNDAISRYQALKAHSGLQQPAHQGTLMLVEYKTAITPRPANLPTRVYIGQMSHIGNFTSLKDSLISGENAIVFGTQKGFVLDGFILENVTFENTTIFYNGTLPVIFKDVRFLNCKFEVSDSPRGNRLLFAAINQPANATIS